jgi:hypothetical protein
MPPKEIPDELIDQLLAGREGPEAITGPEGLFGLLPGSALTVLGVRTGWELSP